MPGPDVDLDMTEAEIGFVDPTADHDAAIDRQVEILAVEPHGTGPVREPVFLVAHPAGDMPDNGDVTVIISELVPIGDNPTDRGEVIRLGLNGKRK